jgi:hypothetical protein
MDAGAGGASQVGQPYEVGGCGMEITVSTYGNHNNITPKYFSTYRNWVQGLLHAIALSQGKGLRLMLVGKTFTTGCLGEVSG